MAKALKLGDKAYPKLLAKIKNPPKKLFYKGSLSQNIFQHCLAVVGTRQMTNYGEEITTKLIGPVARAGVTIVSGFMYGIDAQAHQACLRANGKTIAVLGCGIDLVRPVRHTDLYQNIIKHNGLILSEYEDKHPPFRWTFVRRNRIVAGLSQAILVVEAGKTSGALITAQLAQKQKRKILAVPGPLTSKVSQGTTMLIKKGAILIENYQQILTELGISRKNIKLNNKPTDRSKLSLIEKKIIDLLQNQRLSPDEISRCLKQAPSIIGSHLSLMFLQGFIQEDKKGKYYAD